GVILFEMLAGRPPFDGATYAVLVAKLLTQEPPMLSALRPGLPGSLVTAVHRALAKEPKDRFQTADQFAAALPGDKTASMIELAGTLDSSSGAVAVPPPTLRLAHKKWPLVIVLAAAVACAGVVTFIVVPKDTPAPASAVPMPAVVSPGSATPSVPAHVAGRLHVRTVPAGAMVSIDGQDKGTTPIEITLAPGRYNVQVALDGYHTIASEEDVRSQERSSVVLQLQQATQPIATKAKKPDPKRPPPTKSLPTGPITTVPEPKPEPKPEPTSEPTREPKAPVKGSGGAKPNPY
ncbi:MAG TPA: PEGA domain-containing protein, partial [Kofleriaceae bacterium]|nr:PEGA domain-containing protein [Kofleriaceae bacterium]